jgi:plasmid stabilization system protein ParE
MVKYRIEITNVAEKDIIDIARYVTYELLDRDAADNLVDEFYDTIFSLIDMLKRHKTIEDNDQIIPKGIRRVGVKNYDIYYSCSDEDGIIYIRRVLYGKREWQKFI